MSDTKLNYIGPIPKLLSFERSVPAWWRRIPVAFMLVVVLPTFLAALYFLVIATPRYVSEAQFIVRSSTQSAPSAIGVALQGVGISPAQTDAFAVHQYITSRDSLRELSQRFDIAQPFEIDPRHFSLIQLRRQVVDALDFPLVEPTVPGFLCEHRVPA